MPTYLFGSFQLNAASNGLGYFLLEKELSLPTVKPVTAFIARRDGAKKSGEMVEPRTITLALKVVGSSRLDMLSRLDTLQQALSLRGQQLIIHDTGTRYYQNVDAISAQVPLKAGSGVVQCGVAIVFTAYDPYAYASSSSTYDTGTVNLTSSGGNWVFSTITITGGGTIYALPLIRITNKTSTGSTTLSAGLTSGNNYTSISVNATTFSGSSGDQIKITHGGTSQTLTASANWSVGATTISVSSFNAGANYVSGDAAAKVTQWTSVTVNQTTDNLSLTATSNNLPNVNGDFVDIWCDGSITNGNTIQTNDNGTQIEPLGLFPVIEPTATNFSISIVSGSAVSADATFTWIARYLS